MVWEWRLRLSLYLNRKRDFMTSLDTFYLPRHYFLKTLKTLNLSYVLDSMGTFY